MYLFFLFTICRNLLYALFKQFYFSFFNRFFVSILSLNIFIQYVSFYTRDRPRETRRRCIRWIERLELFKKRFVSVVPGKSKELGRLTLIEGSLRKAEGREGGSAE